MTLNFDSTTGSGFLQSDFNKMAAYLSNADDSTTLETRLDTIQINATQLEKLQKLVNEKAINDVSATASGVLAGSSQVLIDKFLDSTGQNNTVDTGSTTGEYRAGYFYACAGSSVLLEPSFETYTHWNYAETDVDFAHAQSSDWASKGTKSLKLYTGGVITANAYCTSTSDATIDFTSINSISFDYKITKDSQLETFYAKAYIGTTEIFSYTITPNITVYGTATYDCSGISGNQNVSFKLLNGTSDGGGVVNFYIDNITTQYTDSIVQSSVATVPTGMTKVFVTPLMYEALATGDNITADVSIDNGSNYTTDVPINEWTEITSANGTQLIVKANLNTNDGTTTPKIIGWKVDLE